MDLQIINIASNVKYNKEIKNFTHKSRFKNALCGDQIEIRLIVNKQKIEDIGYQCKSCIYCQASASLLAKISINKHLNKIKETINIALDFFVGSDFNLNKDLKKFKYILNKKNISRKECILLPFKTLKKAIQE
tara:strand:+ start:143 stop:541 length:399 start_codon:yes stop_codon:yes gene_type:complete